MSKTVGDFYTRLLVRSARGGRDPGEVLAAVMGQPAPARDKALRELLQNAALPSEQQASLTRWLIDAMTPAPSTIGLAAVALSHHAVPTDLEVPLAAAVLAVVGDDADNLTVQAARNMLRVWNPSTLDGLLLALNSPLTPPINKAHMVSRFQQGTALPDDLVADLTAPGRDVQILQAVAGRGATLTPAAIDRLLDAVDLLLASAPPPQHATPAGSRIIHVLTSGAAERQAIESAAAEILARLVDHHAPLTAEHTRRILRTGLGRAIKALLTTRKPRPGIDHAAVMDLYAQFDWDAMKVHSPAVYRPGTTLRPASHDTLPVAVASWLARDSGTDEDTLLTLARTGVCVADLIAAPNASADVIQAAWDAATRQARGTEATLAALLTATNTPAPLRELAATTGGKALVIASIRRLSAVPHLDPGLLRMLAGPDGWFTAREPEVLTALFVHPDFPADTLHEFASGRTKRGALAQRALRVRDGEPEPDEPPVEAPVDERPGPPPWASEFSGVVNTVELLSDAVQRAMNRGASLVDACACAVTVTDIPSHVRKVAAQALAYGWNADPDAVADAPDDILTAVARFHGALPFSEDVLQRLSGRVDSDAAQKLATRTLTNLF